MLYRRIALAVGTIVSMALCGCAGNREPATRDHELVNLHGLIDPATEFVLESSDGQQVTANVLTVFRLDNKAYAFVKQHGGPETPSLMELVADQKDASFRMIKDRHEFNRVLQIVAKHPEIYPRAK